VTSNFARRFEGKNILVTGSSRGIGAGIARRLATEGARLAITHIASDEQALQIIAGLEGNNHIAVPLDVTSEESVNTAFGMISEKFGTLHGLVNNAGITKDGLLLRMKIEDFQAVIDTNLKGTFLCTRAAVKLMLKARQGSIVNITSVIGEMGNAGQSNYAASKAGTEGFSKSVALEIASRGLRVNCVAPGFIVTEMTEILTDQQKEAILAKVPLNAMGSIEDVAAATAFLLSDEAKYITGHTLSLNGGLYM
jgi:3-oxoacyl-[acyl-carrier protein] reductase